MKFGSAPMQPRNGFLFVYAVSMTVLGLQMVWPAAGNVLVHFVRKMAERSR